MIQRALDVCKKLSHDGDVLQFDVDTICASQDLDPQDVMARLASEGVHTVTYACPEFSSVTLAAASDNTGFRRTAKFSRFHK